MPRGATCHIAATQRRPTLRDTGRVPMLERLARWDARAIDSLTAWVNAAPRAPQRGPAPQGTAALLLNAALQPFGREWPKGARLSVNLKSSGRLIGSLVVLSAILLASLVQGWVRAAMSVGL